MKIFLIFLAILVITNTQVLGIDFGTQFWKASLISPGKNNVIVQNARTGRKTINAMAFDGEIRHFEQDALSKRLKKPQMSHFYLNKLLRSLDFQMPLQGYLFQNGTYYITHQQEKISLEQLVGMIIKNIKMLASQQAGSDIKDCVFSIPANWGWNAKMALINAANIADLSVLGLINENSAAAINFAITRNDTDPLNIGFFNLGSHNLQFSIMQFFGYFDESKGKNVESVKVLSHLVVQDVGGLRVDKQIADYLADQFMKKHNKDAKKNQKSYVKLLHKAADVKQTLSANKQTSVYVQGLIDGIDLNMNIKRQIIQNMEVFKSLNKHLDEAIQKAGIKKQDLNSVQLIGGASRIPLVSKIVKEHFGEIEVGSHINGDQAMAFGSSLRAANLSITFRVKQLHFYDGFQKQVKCVIASQEGVITQQTLFTKDSQHGDKKNMILPIMNDQIKITLFYDQQIVKEYVSQNITQYKTIYNETAYNFSAQPNILLSFVLSTTTIVDLKESYVNLTLNNTKIKQVDEFVEQQEPPAQEDSNSQEQLNKYQSENQDKTQSSQNNNSTSQNGEKNKTEQTPKKQKKIKKKLKKITKTIEQQIIESKKHTINTNEVFTKYHKYTKEQILQNKKILQKFEKHENYLKQKSKIRNDLQSTLYRLKDSFDDDFLTKFSQKNQLQNLKSVVNQKLQWLDENAWTAEKDQFQKQYNQLFTAYQPMYNRSLQEQKREQSYNKTMQYFSYTYKKTQDLNRTHPWLEQLIVKHLKKINQTVQHIHDKLKKQMKKALNQNPEIYNHEMIELAQKLRDQYYILKMMPRPKIKKEKKEEKITQKPEQTQEKQKNEQQVKSQSEQSNEQQKEQEPENTQNENINQQQNNNQNKQNEQNSDL